MTTILHLESVTKVYSGTVALKNARSTIRKGAVNVLVGENGAGKSTMMKIIAGVEQPTLGQILLDGKEVHFHRPADAEAHGICMVFQELNLLGNLTVAENIFMSREVTAGGIYINHKEQERRALANPHRLEAGIRPDMLVEDLMIGQQQLVEIAKAVSLNSRIIIFDEPTSALSRVGSRCLVPRHRRSEGAGRGHRLHLAPAGRADPHWRLHHRAARWRCHRLRVDEECRYPLDHPPDDRFRRQGFLQGSECMLSATRSSLCHDISLPRRTGGLAVDHVGFSVRAGEIFGIYGLMGAGRSELLECIVGRHPQATGTSPSVARTCRRRIRQAASRAGWRSFRKTGSATAWSPFFRSPAI